LYGIFIDYFIQNARLMSTKPITIMELLGPKIRKQRRRLGLTLDELSGRTAISKPYLSLIETGRVSNPPSDEKLRRLEQALGFGQGELLTFAHLQRTPQDVRAMLRQLLANGKGTNGQPVKRETPAAKVDETDDPDPAELSGVLHELIRQADVGIEKLTTNAVPVINRMSGDYPKGFVDLSYPRRSAEQYVGCPDVSDKDAFAARVQGDSMTPKYREGDIVIFSPAVGARNGDDCFVRFADGQTTFKRAFFETGETGQTPTLRLQPRNEKYAPIIIPSERVAGLYRAVFRYQRIDDE
jgi:repressor LexA